MKWEWPITPPFKNKWQWPNLWVISDSWVTRCFDNLTTFSSGKFAHRVQISPKSKHASLTVRHEQSSTSWEVRSFSQFITLSLFTSLSHWWSLITWVLSGKWPSGESLLTTSATISTADRHKEIRWSMRLWKPGSDKSISSKTENKHQH